MGDLRKIQLRKSIHNGKVIVCFLFEYDKLISDLLKRETNIRWSQTKRFWYLDIHEFNLRETIKMFKGIAEVSYSDFGKHLKKEQKLEVKELKKQKQIPESYLAKLEQRRYSKNTISIYTKYFKDFINYFSNKEADSITKEEINAYILKLIREKNISSSQQNQRVNAIKFYYEQVLGRDKTIYNIDRPKKERVLPTVLSEQEVLKILKHTKNLKHKAIIATIYSAGLRRSELINLRKKDVDFDKGLIFIKQGKGKKDRISMLSESLQLVLKKYLEYYKPNYWLFEGVNRHRYSATSISHLIKKSAKRANIDKNVTPHTLRHSFATHLLEQGVDIRYIQTFLGHNSAKTTQIYTYVSKKSLAKIKSPLDTILNDN